MAGLQGRTLGGYQLTEQIASAGIAEVYRARPLAANGREVVIKVIYPEFARYPSFLPNFQHIIQTAARLASHPHILPVVASGEENGYLYLAAPWVADGTLRDWIARGGRLGVSDAAPFFHQLGSALSYAHSLGLVHGNLKPSNVFLFEGRHVLLGDFGMLWDIRQLDMNHSGSGVDVVEYLAPESFSGQFTQQSDIYSLGAILFATLTGRPPFSGSKPADLRDAHMRYPPPRLGQVDPSLPPGVQALDPVIQQAMSKNPGERFPSAMALAEAIDAILKQQPAMPSMQMPPALPAPGQYAQAAGMPQGAVQPGVPGSWGAPGPIGPSGIGALPAPGGPALQPPQPPFPPMNGNGAQQVGAPMPMAQGWPAADGVQYTERVPAPPVARPLVSRPQLPPPDAAAGVASAPLMPPMGDDPEWRHDPWPAENGASRGYGDDFSQPDDPPRRQAARDDDWRLTHNSPSHAGPSRVDFSDFPSEYTDQRLARVDSGYDMSRADWGQSGPHSEALRYRGGFSATELGLPRLTNPALQGELPPEWEDLLAGEMLPRRSDLGPGKPAQARRNAPDSFATESYAPESYAYSSVGQPYAPNGPVSRPAGRREPGASNGRRYEESPPARPGRQRDQPLPTLASSQYPAYTANGMQRQPDSRVPYKAREPRKRLWPRLVLLAVLLLALVGGVGVVLAKPTVCPGTLCVQANRFLHKNLTFLGPVPNANILHATPNALTVQAVSGSSTNLSVQVNNSGTDAALWHATASVAWLSISPHNGTLAPGGTVTLGVAATPADVTPGNYSALVTVETAETTIHIPVTANIAAGPKLELATTTMTVHGSQCNSSQSFKMNNSGDMPLSYTVTTSKATAITLGKSSGSIDPRGNVTVPFTINCAAFFADYTISVTSDGGKGTVTIHYTT
ncbi:MAG TPA: protein kinase [Ktedonobacterales bacterium]|nr:protein kinase [Ktedonobacterales bacterium]